MSTHAMPAVRPSHAVAALLCAAAFAASAQTEGGSSGSGTSGGPAGPSGTPSSTSGTTSEGSGSSLPSSLGSLPGNNIPLNEANPWYLGASETLTHDTNVFRAPNGPGGNISSTTLVGGFDQPISRQRVSGAANVSYNRYFGHSSLDHTSYNLIGGLDWQTVARLSGNVRVALGRNLAAPVISGVVPQQTRNESDTRSANASVRWGGVANFGIEANGGYSSIDYSAPQYANLDSHQDTAGIALRWLPAGPLRLGIGYRETHLHQPQAIGFANGSTQRNDSTGKNVDLLVDYALGPTLSFSGRLSHTKQTNSGLTNADFSGATGNAVLSWQITGKTGISAYFSRDVGFNTTPFSLVTVFLLGNTPVLSTVNGIYENNQLTTTAGLVARWRATGKIEAHAGLRYSRARLVSTLVLQSATEAVPDTIDVSKVASVGATWDITRGWSLGCNLSHENRDVTGTVRDFSWTATAVGCTGQYTWR